MESTTASTIGTIAGSFAASFLAQMWGNFVTRKTGSKVVEGTASQTTVNEIRDTVTPMASKVETLVKQPGVIQTGDDRSPKGESK